MLGKKHFKALEIWFRYTEFVGPLRTPSGGQVGSWIWSRNERFRVQIYIWPGLSLRLFFQ